MLRLLLCLTLLLAGCAGEPPPSAGFALISPGAAASLRNAPPSPARDAVLRAAVRELERAPRPVTRVPDAEALAGFRAARDLALAARLTGEPRYAAAAARLLAPWVLEYQPNYSPPDETGFDALFIAWDLLPEDQRAPLAAPMSRLLRRFAQGYLGRPPQGSAAASNGNSQRVKLIALSAWALGNGDLIRRARAAFAAHLEDAIRPDGSPFDFAMRDSVEQAVVSLEPLALTALAAQQHGETWMLYADRALPRALAWLEPYAAGRRGHEEFADTELPFDRTRRDAGAPGYSGPFNPAHARLTMAYAARLDRSFPRTAPPEDQAWLAVVLP